MTELTFKGKEFVYNHHLSVPFRPLVPHADKGIGDVDLDGNLIIQGDNLHALKALLPRYAGKVDCIFIDPPYNTGNEGWAYNDNVNAPMIKEWLAANPIGIEDGLRHDKWCAMMWPRLRLLHELLAEHGALWMTIDYNEMERAKSMFEEIFGENHVVATITTEANPRGRQSDVNFATVNDYLLCVAKNTDELVLNGVAAGEEYIEEFDQFDETNGPWRELGLRQRGADSLRSDREDMFFPIFVNPKNGRVALNGEGDFTEKVIPKKSDGREGRWSWSPAEVTRENARVFGRKVRGKNGKERYDVFIKDYLLRGGVQRTKKPKTIWTSDIANTELGGIELKSILGSKAFSYPKPRRLLEEILQISTTKNGIVLDSFSGSGTTAHAVLSSNKRDDGNRKFILVEMEDYADKLTAERVRRVIKGYDYSGTQKSEMLRETLNYRTLQKADELVQKVNAIENLYGTEYDKITKQVKDNELIVTGEKTVAQRAEGLGGTFTFCTLGPPVELDKILTGKDLPSYDALGSLLYHMATSRTLESSAIRQSDCHLGEHGNQHVWLIYKPDLDWLKGPDAALTLGFARKIATDYPGRDHLVFAASRFVSEKLLGEEGLRVEFVPLPFALYRIEKV